MSKQTAPILICVVLVSALSACGGTPAGALQYSGPSEQTIGLGLAMPGTNIQYIAKNAEGALVDIGGQRAVKKVGDSLDWKGEPMSGVEVALAQRVVFANEEHLQTAGTVKITVRDAQPSTAQFPDNPAYSYAVPVTYNVRRGSEIPGTLLRYAGKRDEGAALEGVSGYAFRRLGDSITWNGRLRSNAYVDMTLRVLAYTDDFMQVGGVVTVALTGE